MTEDPATFISAMRKLAEYNLVFAGRAAWWVRAFIATHPSLDETIAQARRYAAKRDIPLEREANANGTT